MYTQKKNEPRLDVLEVLHARNELPNLDTLTAQLAPRPSAIPPVDVLLPELTSYDALIEVVSLAEHSSTPTVGSV